MRRIFGRGLNISGQIDKTYENYPKFTQIQELRDKEVKSIGCGYLQTFYFLKNGILLKRGRNLDTTSSIRTLNFYRLFPSAFHLLQSVVHTGRYLGLPLHSHDLVCMNFRQLHQVNFTRAVFSQAGIHLFDDQSNMYVIGENYFGQRATGNCITLQSFRKIQSFTPTAIQTISEIRQKKEGEKENQIGSKIVDIALGFQHSIFITQKGEAYGCGKADFYQIQPYRFHYYKDRITLPHIERPELIWGRRKVVKVACGYKHSILMTQDNKLYGLGSNKFGQCGVDSMKQDQVKRLTEIDFPFLIGEEVIDIKCGSHHTLILTNRHLYFMGSNKKNQNPFSTFKYNICSPSIMNMPAKPIKIFTNFERSAVICEDGKAYIFGGSDLQYRGGEKSELEVVDSFKFTEDSQIGLGFAHTIIAP